MWTAVKQVFPTVQIIGCNFHFRQCIWRKVQELGIVTAYRHHHKTRRAVASLWGLAFLPVHHIPEALEYVQSQFTGLEPLMEYFIDTWMNGPYDMGWVVYRQPIRTNNSLEGWHNKLNRQLRVTQPPTFMLIDELVAEAETVSLEIKEKEAGVNVNVKRKKYVRLNAQWRAVWDKVDETGDFVSVLERAYHLLPAIEDAKDTSQKHSIIPEVFEN